MRFFWSKSKTEESDRTELIEEAFFEYERDMLLDYFKELTGMNFSNKRDSTGSKLRLFCAHKDISSFKKLLDFVKSESDIRRDLIDYLTVNETYFNREYNQIKLLPSLIKSKGKKLKFSLFLVHQEKRFIVLC